FPHPQPARFLRAIILRTPPKSRLRVAAAEGRVRPRLQSEPSRGARRRELERRIVRHRVPPNGFPRAISSTPDCAQSREETVTACRVRDRNGLGAEALTEKRPGRCPLRSASNSSCARQTGRPRPCAQRRPFGNRYRSLTFSYPLE